MHTWGERSQAEATNREMQARYREAGQVQLEAIQVQIEATGAACCGCDKT